MIKEAFIGINSTIPLPNIEEILDLSHILPFDINPVANNKSSYLLTLSPLLESSFLIVQPETFRFDNSTKFFYETTMFSIHIVAAAKCYIIRIPRINNTKTLCKTRKLSIKI